MKDIVIGITASTLAIKNAKRTFVNQNDILAITQAGGIPVLIPTDGAGNYKKYLEICDGFYFPGGPDVSPLLFETEPAPDLGYTEPSRDQLESALIKAAIQAKKPLLGVCRGLQIINVALGGNLYQDLSKEFPKTDKLIQHAQVPQLYELSHHVYLKPRTRISSLFDTPNLLVNSHHHQAVRQVGKGLQVVATASDGVVEGIESVSSDLVLAVQWHPEYLYQKHPKMKILFKDLIDRSEKYKTT